MKIRTIEQEWLDFRKKVIPHNASAVQVNEMKKAYYMGAYAMLQLSKALGDEDISEEEGVQFLEQNENFLHHFFKNLSKRGFGS
ncbi:hypothetical protein WA1_19035 [Scytonema hofmannii PCC 7110]|uniref:Uncharacterized protein n=1 Tax=Scytonema hofmannii PCC 7110 TaxID=128403 RepID=A0A139XBR9_9CYAN|nr:hypothetical protein [Scytonema hofmannii]KYC42096.1 hypothetical protein WA1_19035 [Scytonema hofmannii PCC 7110]